MHVLIVQFFKRLRTCKVSHYIMDKRLAFRIGNSLFVEFIMAIGKLIAFDGTFEDLHERIVARPNEGSFQLGPKLVIH
jgi:hypothetical protein